MQIQWERCYKKSPNIVSRKVADKHILVPIRNNVGDLESIYTLNEVAGLIWDLIDSGNSVEEIKNKIVEEFEVSPDEAEKDIEGLFKQLEEIQAIE